MSRLLLTAAVCLFTTTITRAADPPPKPADPLVELLAKLDQPAAFDGDLDNVPLFDFLQSVSKKHGVRFVINEQAFADAQIEGIRDRKPTLAATKLDGMSLDRFLARVLESVGAVAHLRKDRVEIVPPTFPERMDGMRPKPGAPEGSETWVPFVSVVFKDKPLTEAVAEVAERHDVTVVLSPAAGDTRTTPVSARFLNVPLDRALELLAIQADLRVVPRGNTYLVTSAEQASGLAQEEIDRAQQKADREMIDLRRGGLGYVPPRDGVGIGVAPKSDGGTKKKKGKKSAPPVK